MIKRICENCDHLGSIEETDEVYCFGLREKNIKKNHCKGTEFKPSPQAIYDEQHKPKGLDVFLV